MNISSVIKASLFPLAAIAARLGSPDHGGYGDSVESSQESHNSLYILDKNSHRDDSLPLLEPSLFLDQGQRRASICTEEEGLFRFDLVTDNYAYETSWELTKGDEVIVSGPPSGLNYADDTYYSGTLCLSNGNYNLTMHDRYADGICCQFGSGHYQFYIDGVLEYNSSMIDESFQSRDHPFSIDKGASSTTDCSNVTIELQVDSYGEETNWELRDSSGSIVMSLDAVTPANGYNVTKQCIPYGDYEFKIFDFDGLCCAYGEGYFKVIVDGTVVFRGAHFVTSISQKIKLGYNYTSEMNTRELEWLDAHNSRREQWHLENGTSFVPLAWSKTLAADAKNWSLELLNDCDISGIRQQSGVLEGENIWKETFQGDTYGDAFPVEDVLTRWVEFEENRIWPRNSRLTQVLWRPTQYVGCGDSFIDMGGGKVCRSIVCRYAKAGNCEIGRFGSDWKAAVFQDDSGCAPQCPVEGCFAPLP